MRNSLIRAENEEGAGRRKKVTISFEPAQKHVWKDRASFETYRLPFWDPSERKSAFLWGNSDVYSQRLLPISDSKLVL